MKIDSLYIFQMVLKSSSTVEKGDDYKFFSDLFNAESNQYHLIFAPSKFIHLWYD